MNDSSALPRASTADEKTVDELLAEMQRLEDALEYEELYELTRVTLSREGLTRLQRVRALYFQAVALAVGPTPVDAEHPFRELLRLDPSFEITEGIEPKIMMVFRKVQVEEKTRRERAEELRRKEIIGQIAIDSDGPYEGKGGTPLEFRYRLRDPTRSIRVARLFYRKDGLGSYSSYVLKSVSGHWVATLPAEFTANDDGVRVQYYLVTEDASGTPLATLGGPKSPLQVKIAPGQPPGPRIYKSPWLWTSVGAAVAIAAGLLVFYTRDARSLPPSDGRIDLGNLP